MATVTVSRQIAAPIEEVFKVFTDFSHASDRVSGIKKLQVLTSGPVALRTRWIETREVMGRLDSAEMEITAYERNRMYTITHHKAGVRIDTTFWFEPHGAATEVSVEFELDSAGCHQDYWRRSAGRSPARSKACCTTISPISRAPRGETRGCFAVA